MNNAFEFFDGYSRSPGGIIIKPEKVFKNETIAAGGGLLSSYYHLCVHHRYKPTLVLVHDMGTSVNFNVQLSGSFPAGSASAPWKEGLKQNLETFLSTASKEIQFISLVSSALPEREKQLLPYCKVHILNNDASNAMTGVSGYIVAGNIIGYRPE